MHSQATFLNAATGWASSWNSPSNLNSPSNTPLKALPAPTPWLDLIVGLHPPEFHSSHAGPVAILKANHTMACNSSCGPTTTGGHTWPIYGISLEHPALVARQDCTSETHKTSSEKHYFSRLGETNDIQKTQRTYKLMKTSSTSFVIREMQDKMTMTLWFSYNSG